MITKETLESGQQPDNTLESWVGQAIGAATMIDYGPTHPDTVFDERSANAIVDWAVTGIRKLLVEAGVVEPGADLRTALARVLNSYSRENGSDTPDFVLAQYLTRVGRVRRRGPGPGQVVGQTQPVGRGVMWGPHGWCCSSPGC